MIVAAGERCGGGRQGVQHGPLGRVGGTVVYGGLKLLVGLRLDQEQEYEGADLSIHRITATPEREPNW